MTVFYDDILLGSVLTNRSLTVEEALDLIGFDMETFMEVNGLYDIDYGMFTLVNDRADV